MQGQLLMVERKIRLWVLQQESKRREDQRVASPAPAAIAPKEAAKTKK